MAHSQIPVLGFSAWSGTGKTTLVEKIIRILAARGIKCAVVKHDAHDFDIDHPGKDSYRFTQAGSVMTVLSSPTKTAVVEQRPHSLQENLALIHGVDLILVEGYKQEAIPRIGISRLATGKGLPCPATDYLAVVTDDPGLAHCGVPVFGLEDTEELVNYFLSALHIDFDEK